jgi:hypothetical protein
MRMKTFFTLLIIGAIFCVSNVLAEITFRVEKSNPLSSMSLSCRVSDNDKTSGALVTLKRFTEEDAVIVRKSYLKVVRSKADSSTIGMTIHLREKSIKQEWDHPWIIDRFGRYRVTFQFPDGHIESLIIKFVDGVGGPYLEMTSLGRSKGVVPEWAEGLKK